MTVKHLQPDPDQPFHEALRDLADFLERRTRLSAKIGSPTIYVFCRNEAEFQQFAGGIGAFRKNANDNFLEMHKFFGTIKLDISISREVMCEKRVVGTREVEQTREVYPEGVEPDVVTETVIEEITEWVCPPTWRA